MRPPTRFVGRARDLTALEGAFAKARLVTVTGPGGVGKTRLATEYGLLQEARATRPRRRVWFCDLSSARDADDVCLSVAQGLGVALAGGADPVRQLGRVLEQRADDLVILDNFEQVAAHATETVGLWLSSRTGPHLLVTSREHLHLQGEALVRLEPLPIAQEDADPAGAGEAVELLRDRLGRLQADPATLGAPELVEIARRLDGIPLALELAAARIAVFGAATVAARLQGGLEALGRASRDVAARQETMARTISWSWELLAPWEQDTLAQCASFRGGFTLEAAEAIVDLSRHADAPAVIDVVEALRDKSLLRSTTPSPRFDVYEVVRAFVRERTRPRTDDDRQRHADHFLRLGELLSAELDGPRGAEALGQLAVERANLAVVLERSLEPPVDATTALRAGLVLSRFHGIRGPLGLQVRRLDAALQVADQAAPPPDPALRTRALLARGNAKRLIGRVAEGRADLEKALALARDTSDVLLEGEAQAGLASTAIQEARVDVALTTATAAVDLLRGTGAGLPLAGALRIVGNAHHHLGHVDQAVAAYEEAIELYRGADNRREEGTLLTALANAYLESGRRDEAVEMAERSVRIHHELGDRWEAHDRLGLGLAHIDARDWARARATLEEGMAVGRQVGDAYVEAVCHGYLGLIDCASGAPDRGAAALGESLETVSWGVCASLLRGFLGGALARLERVDRATELLDRAERELEAADSPLLLEAVHLQRALLELALARRAETASDGPRAAAYRKAAQARLAAVATPTAAGSGRPATPALADRSVDVRLSVAIVEAAGLGSDRDAGGPAAAFTIDTAGRWFVTPAGRRVDCRRRPLVGRLLLALAQHRLRHPGDVLRAAELVDAGWPNERILPDAAKNRLYVALSRVRAMGLADVVRSEGDGYLIDPSVTVRVVR